MKRQRVLSFLSLRCCGHTASGIFDRQCCLCGALAGSCTGLRSGHSEGALLEQLAGQMVAQAQVGDGAVGVLAGKALVGALGWQAAAILCGMLRGHSLWLSGLCAARGFLLAFSAGAFLSTMQWEGLLLALVTGGVSAIVTVPCLYLDGICVLPGRAGGVAAPWWILVCLGAVPGRGAAVHGYGAWRWPCARTDAVFGGTAGLIAPGKFFAKIIEKKS